MESNEKIIFRMSTSDDYKSIYNLVKLCHDEGMANDVTDVFQTDAVWAEPHDYTLLETSSGELVACCTMIPQYLNMDCSHIFTTVVFRSQYAINTVSTKLKLYLP